VLYYHGTTDVEPFSSFPVKGCLLWDIESGAAFTLKLFVLP
jgi:hypothetical protein